MKKALITGITGQDGSYLSELLFEKGYEVHGVIRRHSTPCTERIDHLLSDAQYDRRLFLHYGDLTDSSNAHRLIQEIQPNEVYNLAAQSHVAVSFEVPEYTAEATGVGTIRLLEAVRQSGLPIRFYQASTSELFGGLPDTAPQSEATPFYPKSPYGAAKLYSFWITKNYRESYDMFAVNGILFNHESPRRGETFVTRKITLAIARIMAGMLRECGECSSRKHRMTMCLRRMRRIPCANLRSCPFVKRALKLSGMEVALRKRDMMLSPVAYLSMLIHAISARLRWNSSGGIRRKRKGSSAGGVRCLSPNSSA